MCFFSASYPQTPPSIIVRSNSSRLAAEEIEMLQTAITSSAGEHHGSPMIHDLIQTARTWLENHTYTENASAPEASRVHEASSGTKPKKRSKAKKHQEENVETDSVKKLSMKTAADVISRIVWDEEMPADCFTVGYLDRFKGIVENNFTAFSWEDLSAVDYTVLAIPQHRIQYFKYHDIIVWDKKDRLDNVFGSTGSGLTIADVMSKYEAEKPQRQTSSTVSHDSDDDSDDDDSDDDGIVVNVGTSCGDADDGHWENKLRPNYFLCVRITDPEIMGNLEALQESILEVEPRYDECCVKSTELHVTICTLGLDTVEQVSTARQALEKMSSELRAMAEKNIRLTIKGVSNFFDRVLYGQVQHDQDFTHFNEHIRMTFSEFGVEVRDAHDYVPHMTIMKVTRLGERRLRQKTIDPDIGERVKDMYFGTQVIDAVHLCSMKEKTEEGFYRCAASVDLLNVEQ